MLSRRSIFAAVLVLPLTSPALAQDKLPVVASFSVLGDFVRHVGGDRVAVSLLVPADGDAHVFSPSPADAKKLTDAKMVFVNGLGFEGWLDRLVKASGTKAPVVAATKGIKVIELKEDDNHGHGHGHGHDHGHDHGDLDPHAWQAVANAKLYVGNVRDALIAADPDGRSVYEKNAADYLAALDEVDKEIRATVAKIPRDRRRIITSHDAFGYFEAAYGIRFITPQGVSTDAEASARDVARIIRQIRSQKIPAVFLENVTDARLMKRIASETGAKVGGTLYSDALSAPSGPAPTYIEMMRHNLRQLAAALTS